MDLIMNRYCHRHDQEDDFFERSRKSSMASESSHIDIKE